MTSISTPASPEISSEIKALVLKLISDSDEPMKPAKLVKAPGMPKKLSGKALQVGLEPELESGPIFNWGTTKTHLYWHRAPKAEARERLLTIVACELVDKTALKAAAAAGLPKLPANSVPEALNELEHENRFRLVTPSGTKKKYVLDAEHPEPYLAAEITRLLQSFGRERLVAPMTALLADKTVHEMPSASSGTGDEVREIAAKMFDAVTRIASPGTTVTFYRLRQQPELAHVPKAIFDQAALLLEQRQNALLSRHDHAASLPPEERERFVTDGLGSYYVSIYTR